MLLIADLPRIDSGLFAINHVFCSRQQDATPNTRATGVLHTAETQDTGRHYAIVREA